MLSRRGRGLTFDGWWLMTECGCGCLGVRQKPPKLRSPLWDCHVCFVFTRFRSILEGLKSSCCALSFFSYTRGLNVCLLVIRYSHSLKSCCSVAFRSFGIHEASSVALLSLALLVYPKVWCLLLRSIMFCCCINYFSWYKTVALFSLILLAWTMYCATVLVSR